MMVRLKQINPIKRPYQVSFPGRALPDDGGSTVLYTSRPNMSMEVVYTSRSITGSTKTVYTSQSKTGTTEVLMDDGTSNSVGSNRSNGSGEDGLKEVRVQMVDCLATVKHGAGVCGRCKTHFVNQIAHSAISRKCSAFVTVFDNCGVYFRGKKGVRMHLLKSACSQVHLEEPREVGVGCVEEEVVGEVNVPICGGGVCKVSDRVDDDGMCEVSASVTEEEGLDVTSGDQLMECIACHGLFKGRRGVNSHVAR